MLAVKSWFDFRKPPPLPPRPRVTNNIILKTTIQDEPKPIKNEAKPIENQAKPVEDEPKPIENGPKPIENEPKPIESESKSVGDEPKPTENESKPMENEPKATENESAPTEDGTKTTNSEKPMMGDARDEDSDTETIFTEQTTTAGASFWDHTAVRDAVPWAGQTFVLVDKASGRVLSHTNGELHLEDNTSRKGCWHWLCVERDGWLGFRNTASGRYLGMNVWGVLQAEVRHHQGWEYFSARQLPNGGYLLQSTQTIWKLLTVGFNKDGILVANTGVEGIVWEFVKV